MKKILVLLSVLVVVLLLVSGCGLWPTSNTPPEPKQPVTKERPENWEGISGIGIAKIHIDGLFPGAVVDTFTEDCPEGTFQKGDPIGVMIVNNRNEATQFRLSVIAPHQERDGYVKAPDYVLEEWITISDLNPTLEAKETRIIPVSLWMPPDAKEFAKKWEFQIMVEDLSQTGNVRTVVGCRWLVEMK